MKKFFLLYALAVTLSLAGVLRRYRTETHRLEQNQRALLSQVERYRTRAGEAAASAEVLQLRCREFERLRAGDAERIRQLGIRLRRVEAEPARRCAEALPTVREAPPVPRRCVRP